MKKIILILVMILLLTGCAKNKTKSILKELEIDKDCELETLRDTHGGFHGDGEYFSKIKCEKIKSDDLSDIWVKYPLSEQLDIATNMEQCDSKNCKSIYEKYGIPTNIAKGYYYFTDRHPDNYSDRHNDVNVNNRASYNYSLAILDLENSTIYYYELDT